MDGWMDGWMDAPSESSNNGQSVTPTQQGGSTAKKAFAIDAWITSMINDGSSDPEPDTP
jgi:hypothetical protein